MAEHNVMYRAFLRLLARHEDHSEPCTYVPETDRPLECPCFPFGLTEEAAEDYCRFSGVRVCPVSNTLMERAWCNSGRGFLAALRTHLF